MIFNRKEFTNKKHLINSVSGFTLIEVLLVIAILAILAAVVIIAINPAKQIAEAQDTQRRSDVRTIINAIQQYALDNDGAHPTTLPPGENCLAVGLDICQSDVPCDGVSLANLLVDQVYLTEIPSDPSGSDTAITGYRISVSDTGRVSVCSSEGSNPISVTQ